MNSIRGTVTVAGLLAVTALLLLWLFRRPSNDRDWDPNQAVLAWAEFEGSRLLIHNVRNTSYRSAEDFTPVWQDRSFDLDSLESVWFVMEPLSRWGGVAHTFLSFGFGGSRYVTVSVEARRERGETYRPLPGMFRAYEIIYVVAEERDAIGLRSSIRRDQVFLYPIRATREKIRALLVDMLTQANRLRDRPAFYNTLTSNCTNTIVRHVNIIAPREIPFSFKTVLPGYSDRLAYDLGLIDTALPYDSIRPHFRINARAEGRLDSPDFSERLRAFDSK